MGEEALTIDPMVARKVTGYDGRAKRSCRVKRTWIEIISNWTGWDCYISGFSPPVKYTPNS